MKAYIDRVLGLAISKKLTVFALGTIFMFKDDLNSDQWLNLAIMYIGTQGTIDLLKTYFSSKK